MIMQYLEAGLLFAITNVASSNLWQTIKRKSYVTKILNSNDLLNSLVKDVTPDFLIEALVATSATFSMIEFPRSIVAYMESDARIVKASIAVSVIILGITLCVTLFFDTFMFVVNIVVIVVWFFIGLSNVVAP